MDFAPIVRELRDHNYDKWILIEHDTHLRPSEIDLKRGTVKPVNFSAKLYDL